MLRHFLPPVLVLIMLTVQSCYFTGNNYTFLNPGEAIKNVDKREHNLRHHMQPYQLDAPLLSVKGDRYVRLGLTNGVCLSAATAPSKHWRWQGGISYGYFKKTFEEVARMQLHVIHYTDGTPDDAYDMFASGTLYDVVRHKQIFIESSAGYFFNPGNKIKQEVYGGLGVGSSGTIHELRLFYDEAEDTYTMDESRREWQGFVQYNLGTGGQKAEINTMHRLAYARQFDRIVNKDPFSITTAMDPDHFLYAGAVRVAAGKKNTRFFLQYEWMLPIGGSDLMWRNTQFSAGVVFRSNKADDK